MTWPTTLSKTHLDQTSDDPSQARAELAAGIDAVNDIIGSRDAASGICPLDASGLVPTSNLAAAVDNAALQDDAVEADNIADSQIGFNHLKATITNDTATPTGGSDGDLWFIYD
jgi:hypothetical protein